MSLPFENALQRERECQRRQREGGQHTDLSGRMDTPTLSPAGVGSLSAPPPLDISSITDMVIELTRPVDRAQVDQEIEDFNLSYPVNVDDAVSLLTLPPVAGAGTAVTTPSTRPRVAARQPRRRPAAPSPPSSQSDDDGDDDDEDRRRGLRRWLDLLNEDAQQRARGRRIRSITHTNTVTTVCEEGRGRPSVRRTSTRTSTRSLPPSPPRRGRGRRS